jgi:hypothetical protein
MTYLHLVLEHLRPLLDDEVDVTQSNVLDLRFLLKQGDW